MDAKHPESEIPPPAPTEVTYCLRCGGRIEDSLGLGSLCLSCDHASVEDHITEWPHREDRDTERMPPRTDSEKIDQILSLCERLWQAQQEDRRQIAELQNLVTRLRINHDYRHPEDADTQRVAGGAQ